MQSGNVHEVLLIPGDLGLVEDYLSSKLNSCSSSVTSNDSLCFGGIYLSAALREMHQILRFCEELEENRREFLQESTRRYDKLQCMEKNLQSRQTRWSIFKPIQLVANRRLKREFCRGARELWKSTRTTSDGLRRALLSVPSVDFTPVESEYLRNDERIVGLVTELPPPEEMNSPATQEALAAAQKLASILTSSRNPFANPTSSNNEDKQNSAGGPTPGSASSSTRNSVSTPPSSPGSASGISYLNFNVSYNIVTNTDSVAPGLTINNGSEGSGSTIKHCLPVNDTSS